MALKTNETVETLRDLYHLHQQLTALKGRLQRGPERLLVFEAAAIRAKKYAEQLQEERKKALVVSDTKQVRLQDGEGRIKKLQVQLNGASSNVEYQNLKEQIAATEMANSVLADEILEGMEKIDDYDTKTKESHAKSEEVEADRQKAETELKNEEPQIQKEIDRIETELNTAEKSLSPEFQETYRRIVATKQGDTLAPVQGEFCGGCHQKIPLNQINLIMLGDAKPQLCRSCGRILFVPEDWSE